MKPPEKRRMTGVLASLMMGASVAVIGLAMPAPLAASSHATKNPCAAGKAVNPCTPKAANPCAAASQVDPKLVLRPKGTKLMQGNRAELVTEGEKLFHNPKLSTNGMSCNSCHENVGGFMPSFAKPYPHEVAMAKEKGGVTKVHLDEMVQFCMVVPMEARPLPWNSQELAALTAYTAELQKSFQAQAAKAANPCAAKTGSNPCAPKGMNPCAPKGANPCAPKK